MSDYQQDLDDVRAVIQLYIDGANGDGQKMRQAFHDDARMFGHIGSMDTYIPIGDFVDYFTVARIAGRWQIACKTYAHTGGEPPAH